VKGNTVLGAGSWITLANQNLVVERNRVANPDWILPAQRGPGPAEPSWRYNRSRTGHRRAGKRRCLQQSDSGKHQQAAPDRNSGLVPGGAFSGFNTFRGNQGEALGDRLHRHDRWRGTAGTRHLWKSNQGNTCSPPGLLEALTISWLFHLRCAFWPRSPSVIEKRRADFDVPAGCASGMPRPGFA